MLCYFANFASLPSQFHPPFLRGLTEALSRIELVCPGYAKKMIDRLGAIAGKGEVQFEQCIQILAEVYVAEGSAVLSDRNSDGETCFVNEPGQDKMANPEFLTTSSGISYSIEVKCPQLLNHSRQRAGNNFQLSQRLPAGLPTPSKPTLPRDNPVKDFLISANSKFQSELIPDNYFRILTIVWDDFCYEPIAALLGASSGLFTPRSFYKVDGQPVEFPDIDGVVICRYQHQICRALQERPLGDGEVIPFVYHHTGYPPKAFVQNPNGRIVPGQLIEILNSTPIGDCLGAEYRPNEMVMWINTSESDV